MADKMDNDDETIMCMKSLKAMKYAPTVIGMGLPNHRLRKKNFCGSWFSGFFTYADLSDPTV